MTSTQRDTGEYQRLVGDFVQREVHYCVSSLISDLAKMDEGEYYEEILNVCIKDDWETTAHDEGWRAVNVVDGEGTTDLDCWTYVPSDYKDAPCEDDDSLPGLYDTEAKAWRAACEHNSLDPEQDEAYEHWIVSDWLADKLEAKGEMISKDIHGLTVWGRCTSGQAILLDGVICNIYDDIHGDDQEGGAS